MSDIYSSIAILAKELVKAKIKSGLSSSFSDFSYFEQPREEYEADDPNVIDVEYKEITEEETK